MVEDIYDILTSEHYLKKSDFFKKIERNKKKNNVLNKIYENDTIKVDKHSIDIEDNTNKILRYVNKLKIKYKDELDEYKFIDGNNIQKMKEGNLIRYVNLKGELKWGGILVKIENKEKISKITLTLRNTKNKLWKVRFNNYYIFQKKIKTKNDKFRDLFMQQANLE